MSGKTIKKSLKAAGQISPDEHLASGNCKKVLSGLLVTPAKVISADLSTTATLVGKGNILRIRVAAATFINFGTSAMVVPTGAEQTSLELNTAGVYLVVASDDFLMASVNPARVEVIDAINS